MRKKVIKIIGFTITIALTFAMIQGMGWFLAPQHSRVGLDVIRAFHTQEKDSLDVIVYGSSHAWMGCDTRFMSKKYDFSAYNYGCNWQAINTTEVFLEDSFRTQSPKVVCIETFSADMVLEDTDMDGQIYYTRAMENFEGKKKYLKKCFGDDIERYASYVFPLITFHENWNEISKENYTKPDFKSYIESDGFFCNYTVYSCQLPDYREFEQAQLCDEAIQTLDEIVRLCDEKNADIIFYTCPWAGEYNYSDAMKDYAQKNNCVYIDLFRHIDEMGLDGETDMKDPGHLNRIGAAKVADYLGKYIKENYDL